MSQGRSSKMVSMIRWIGTSRFSIKKSFSLPAGGFQSWRGVPRRGVRGPGGGALGAWWRRGGGQGAQRSEIPDHAHSMGFGFTRRRVAVTCRVHATFSILAQRDNILRMVHYRGVPLKRKSPPTRGLP